MFWSDLKRNVLAREVNQRPSDESIALDEDPQDSARPEEGSNLRDIRRYRPVLNDFDPSGIRNSSLKRAGITENIRTLYSDERLLSAVSRTIRPGPMTVVLNSFLIFLGEDLLKLNNFTHCFV